MSIEVRLLGLRDQSVLANVAPDVFDDPLDMRATTAFLTDPRHRLAVAIDEGLVVGFASAVIYVHPDKPRPELWINEVGVASTHQRRGLGRRLIEELLAVAREADCGEAWVLTDRDNEPAMQLYASAGGQETPGRHVVFTFLLNGERPGERQVGDHQGSTPRVTFPAVNIRALLISPPEYLAAEKSIDGLGAADAERRVAGVAHSVAEIVAHMSFWQDWFHSRCLGLPQPMVSSASAGWPAVAPGTWPTVQARFVERLHELDALAGGDVSRPLTPSIEFPPLASYTLGDALIHVATHNAHHLGQVIVLRQLLGAWPPPAGSWTW